MSTELKKITSFDGIKLNVACDYVDDPKAVLIIAHGVGSFVDSFKYANLAKRVNEVGYVAYRYDQRGHGESEGERVYYEDYAQLFNDLKAVVDNAKKENPGKKVFVWGNSMGALGAMGHAICYPSEADGYIYSVAAIGCKRMKDHSNNPHDTFLLGGPEMEKLVKEGKVKDFVPYMSYGLQYMMDDGSEYVLSNLEKIQSPVLMVNGAEDEIVDWHVCINAFEKLTIKDKTYSLYGGASHELYSGDRMEDVIRETIYWLDTHII